MKGLAPDNWKEGSGAGNGHNVMLELVYKRMDGTRGQECRNT